MKVFVVVATWKEDGNVYSDLVGVYEDAWNAKQVMKETTWESHLGKDRFVMDYTLDFFEQGVG